MKKKILWSDFLNPEKKIAINCQTEAEAKEFFQMLDSRSAKWIDGESLLRETLFSIEDCNTTYSACVTNCTFSPYGISYCGKDHYERMGYTVYHYGEVEFSDNVEDVAVENNEGSDLKKDVLMVIDRLNRLQRDAVMKQNQYRDSFEQWVVFHERESAYRTAAILLERAIKA